MITLTIKSASFAVHIRLKIPYLQGPLARLGTSVTQWLNNSLTRRSQGQITRCFLRVEAKSSANLAPRQNLVAPRSRRMKGRIQIDS